MHMKPLALIFAVLPFPASAEIPTLDPILVTAPKTQPRALNMSSPSPADLARLRPATSDTASLLRDVPGVSLQGAGGVSSLPIIRGLANDRLRIKVDGMDLIASCPNHMNPALSYIDPSQVESIQVWAGISPVSVGGDSIGGSIVVKSADPVFARSGQGSLFKGEIGAFYRSNGNATGGNLAATHATESFNISYTGAIAKSGNYDAGGQFKGRITVNPADAIFTGRTGHTLSLDEVGSTAYETRNHTLGLAFRGGKHLFEARFGYQDMPYQLFPNQRMDMLGNEASRLNLRYLGQLTWGSLEARLYHEKVEHFMNFGADKRFYYGRLAGTPFNSQHCGAMIGTPDPNTCAWGMPMYTEGKTTGASVMASIDLTTQDVLRIGGEYQRYRLDDWWPASGGSMWPHAFWNIRNGERDRLGLFGEWEKQMAPAWQTLLGLRYERVRTHADTVHGYNQNIFPTGNPVDLGMGSNQTHDATVFNNANRKKTDDNFDLTALARYTQSDHLDIEFGLAYKTRSPNLYERYSWSAWSMAATMNNFAGDGNGYVGNINLKPEKATTVSVTFDWHAADRSWEMRATPYFTHVDDYIDAVPCRNVGAGGPCTGGFSTGRFNTLRYANQTARLYGINLSGRMPLARTGAGEFGLRGLLNYTHGKNRDTGDGLYNIMPLHAKLTLTHKQGGRDQGGWDNAIELLMVNGKDKRSTTRNEIDTPGYSLINLRGSYSWKQVRLDFGVENLFDKLYHLPTGGAYLGQGSTMAFNPAIPQWGTAVPGPGRSFYAGINMKF